MLRAQEPRCGTGTVFEHIQGERARELTSEGEIQKAIGVMFSFFEGMGLLLHRKLIDISLVDYITGGSGGVKMLWDKIKPILEGFSKEYNISTFQWTEYLYNELQKREETLPQTQL